MARVLSSNIVMRTQQRHDAPTTDDETPSCQNTFNGAQRLPPDSPVSRAFEALWGPEVEVLDVAAPHAAQGS